MSFHQKLLDLSPVSYWRMNETSGTTCTDSGSLGNDGTYTNTPTLNSTALVPSSTDPSVNYASASTEYVASVGSVSSYSFIQNSATFWIAAVVKLTAYTTDAAYGIIGNTASTGDKGSLLFYDNRSSAGSTKSIKFQAVYGTASNFTITIDAPSAILDNNAHLIIVTSDGSFCSIHVDGVAIGAALVGTLSTGDSTRTMELARLNGATPLFPMNGNISHLAVGNTALTETQIARLYSAYASTNTLSGNITESLSITDWNVFCVRNSDWQLTDYERVTGTSYSLKTLDTTPHSIYCQPFYDGKWAASTAYALDYLVVSATPDTTPHLWKCTTAGTSGGTEPTWNLSGTTSDNTVTWTYVDALTDPLGLGPKIPT